MDNIILLTDSYKVSHHRQYPGDTKTVYSYFESRGGQYPYTVFFGLQYIIKRYLTGRVVTEAKISEARELYKQHFGTDTLFNESGWRYILTKHKGHLPLRIKAVPEGTKVNTGNVLVTIENTDPKCYWLTNYVETLIVQVWYPTTVATQSHMIKNTILQYLNDTGDPAGIGFKLHDFGFRGVSSVESATIGGMAHLVNFMGTDTVTALAGAVKYYGAPGAVGFSIPAAEHSTITSWGAANEAQAYKNMLNRYPKGLVAVVSDSYDIYRACDKIWGDELRDRVMTRDGTLVIRPDSGHPVTVITKVLDILDKRFGSTINDKGYRVLDPHVRIIQGDGVDATSIGEILREMKANKWSADNIAFGMCGALLQKLDRDTQRFAFKCSAIENDICWQDVYKSPITDTGKLSKRGRLKLLKVDAKSYTTGRYDVPTAQPDVLQDVFLNGKLLIDQTFDEIRERSNQ